MGLPKNGNERMVNKLSRKISHKAKQKNVCVSGYQLSLSLGHQPCFFIIVFGFLQLILLENCVCVANYNEF